MKLSNCCCKALKHGEQVCPVCNQVLIPMGYAKQLTIQFKEKQR
jgi:hypothetical protein